MIINSSNFIFFQLWIYLTDIGLLRLSISSWMNFFLNFIYFIYLWLCWVFVSVWGLSLVAASGGHSSSRCAGLSLSWPLPLRSTGSRRAGSAIVAHGLSRSAACGIFPDQDSNPCPLHWQADSQPLRHQGSPGWIFIVFDFWGIGPLSLNCQICLVFPYYAFKVCGGLAFWILLICTFSLFISVSIAGGLSILLIFSNIQILVSLSFSILSI